MSRGYFHESFYSELIRRYWELHPDRRKRKPPKRIWFDFETGKTGIKFGWSFHIQKELSSEISIDVGDRDKSHKYNWELRFQAGKLPGGLKGLSWEEFPRKRACRIAVY